MDMSAGQKKSEGSSTAGNAADTGQVTKEASTAAVVAKDKGAAKKHAPKFVNDGSFMQNFMEMQRKKKAEEERAKADEDKNAAETQVKRKAERKADRQGRKKAKKGNDEKVDPGFAAYMKEVEKYKAQSCKEYTGCAIVK